MTPIEALLSGIAIGALLVLLSQFMGTINNRISTLADIRDGITQILSTPMPGRDTTVEVEDAEVADLVEPSMEPIPVDPANPPRTVTYNPQNPNKVHPPCNCHGEAIEVGDEMVHWPLPNQQGILLFHAGWLKAQGMSPTSH